MARLILLNGPPGAGKSTLAARWADEHPLTANLDVDRVRAMLGGWRSRRIEAGLRARALTLAMAAEHLRGGYDVLVPQYLGRLPFVEQLEGCADACGVPFVEVALMADLAAAQARFDGRTAAAADPAHVEAADGVDAAAYAEMYERFLAVVRARPHTQLIYTCTADVDGSYRDLRAVVGAAL